MTEYKLFELAYASTAEELNNMDIRTEIIPAENEKDARAKLELLFELQHKPLEKICLVAEISGKGLNFRDLGKLFGEEYTIKVEVKKVPKVPFSKIHASKQAYGKKK